MKALVLGGDGFIGSHLVHALEERGHDAIVIDIRRSPNHDLRLEGNVKRIFDEHRDADVCVHLAAKVGRLFGEDNPMETVIDNVGITALVAKQCGKHQMRLAYASTSEVYGDNNETVCDEIAGPFRLPHNLYGISKLFGEDVCRHYAPESLTIWRISMPYGPGLPPGRGRAALPTFIWQAMQGQPISVHRGAERSWCYISDTVAGLIATLEHDSGGVFNVGRDDVPLPLLEVARRACALVGASEELIREVDPPPMQTVVKRLATDRIRALGWTPNIDLDEGMKNVYEWLQANKEAFRDP
ncbi:MAG: epimerase [Fimbriimonadales bacterium]|nr:MAG: epimerase [Fimbriimonadales bacterium]